MKFFFKSFFKLSTDNKFLEIGILFSDTLYEYFCLLVNFSKSLISPSDKSIEEFANFLRCLTKEY